jgi:radical SAM PhpK family P-methyltransferase
MNDARHRRTGGSGTIDCLFIGHNEVDCKTHVGQIEQMGVNSIVSREMSLNYLNYNGEPYYASDILNYFNSAAGEERGAGKFFDYWGGMNLAAAYMGSYLYQRGFSFDFVNSFHSQKEELAEKLKQGNILTIAIITTYYIYSFPVLEIMDFIKSYNRTAKVIIGGPFIADRILSDTPRELQTFFQLVGADFYVDSSQGEATLHNIIKALKEGRSCEGVHNIHYRDGNGYKANPLLKENNRLSENPVDWSLFTDKEPEYVSVRTSISCPFGCAFCSFPKKAGRYQTMSVEMVEKELNSLAGIGSVTSLHFIDDTLNVPVKRFKELLRMMIKNKYHFQWHSHYRCQFADRETVELMKKSGCVGVFLGLESGNDQILKNMNKSASVEEYQKGLALLKEYEILSYGSFIIGFPGETEETVNDMIRFIDENEVDFYNIKIWHHEPFAPIMKEKDKYGITGRHVEWKHNTMNSAQACDLLEKSLMLIKRSIHVPDYGFSFQSFLHLLQKGMNAEALKSFLTAFNRGIKDKIINPSQRETKPEVMRLLELYAVPGPRRRKDSGSEDSGTMAEMDLAADFDLN